MKETFRRHLWRITVGFFVTEGTDNCGREKGTPSGGGTLRLLEV